MGNVRWMVESVGSIKAFDKANLLVTNDQRMFPLCKEFANNLLH